MPMYPYKCECGYEDDEFQHIHDEPLDHCPQCSAKGTYRRQIALTHTSQREFDTPIRMRSIASDNPEGVREFMTAFPDAEMETSDVDHPEYGVPIARNRHDKLKYLQFYDYAEKP